MTLKFGPTFSDEVIAAGLGGLPFSWCDDGTIVGRAALTPEQNSTLEAVISAHNPANIPVPTAVSPRQARLALLSAGLLDKVEAVVSSVGGSTKITWDYATEVNRASPLISTLGAQLQLTDVQIDALFVYASKQ